MISHSGGGSTPHGIEGPCTCVTCARRHAHTQQILANGEQLIVRARARTHRCHLQIFQRPGPSCRGGLLCKTEVESQAQEFPSTLAATESQRRWRLGKLPAHDHLASIELRRRRAPRLLSLPRIVYPRARAIRQQALPPHRLPAVGLDHVIRKIQERAQQPAQQPSRPPWRGRW